MRKERNQNKNKKIVSPPTNRALLQKIISDINKITEELKENNKRNREQ